MSETRLINAEQGERICAELARLAENSYTIDPSATSARMISQSQGEKIISELSNIYLDKSWERASDATLVKMVAAADAGQLNLEDYWSVGAERHVFLNAMEAGDSNVAHAAQWATLVLMDTNHYNLKTPVTSGSTCHFVVGFKNCLEEHEKIEDSDINSNGWANTRARRCCDAIFNTMIPSTLQPIFKQFEVVTASKGGSNPTSGSLQTYSDGKLALFAEKEVGWTAQAYSVISEQNALRQIQYYEVMSNRIKYVGNGSSSSRWWLRSPSWSSSSSYVIMYTGGSPSIAGSSTLSGFAPFGVI